ncbi:MAG: SRPBCC family protein [Bdellovibrionota bacterium]
MAKKISLVILAIVVMLLGYAALQPADYVISRKITINAPAEKIFPYLNNSRLAEQWGPWLEVDPQAKMVYSGPDAGVGSRTSWESGGRLGTGSATIVDSVPNQKVGIKLEYVKPMNMTQDSEYLVKSSGNQSEVTWRVQGKNNFMGNLMCLFMNRDKMVGGMFEKGLSNLKALVEKSN